MGLMSRSMIQVPIISYKDRVELQQERERERAWELGMRR